MPASLRFLCISVNIDFSVLLLMFFNGISNQYKNLTVCTATFIIRNNMQFVKKIFIYSDR